MPRHDDDAFDDPDADEKHNRSGYAEERDRYAGEYSRARRDRTPERQSHRSPRRESEYQLGRKGKERESSPLNFNPNYMDDPEKHRDVKSQRHQQAVEQVGRGYRVDSEKASSDNQTARRDREGAGIQGKDFAYSGSERKHGGSRDKGKERRR